MRRPTKAARQAEILAELGRGPSLRVAELAGRLAVSTETIRRDLDELTHRGLIDRTYGGAVRPLAAEPSLDQRHRILVAERQAIARAAADLVRPGSHVMIGSGATTLHVARRIAAVHRDLTVITHSFGVAAALAANPTIAVLVAPGGYHGGEAATLGAHAVAFLAGFAADVAILGASGLAADGPADALIESAAVYAAMVVRAAEVMVVADHAKFDRRFPARYAAWPQVARLVTDRAPEGALAAALAEAGVAVTVAG